MSGLMDNKITLEEDESFFNTYRYCGFFQKVDTHLHSESYCFLRPLTLKKQNKTLQDKKKKH